MSYLSVVEMASSMSLLSRIAAAAATEGLTGRQPDAWAQANAWKIAASPGWADAWDYARSTYTSQFNPDTGARPDVISDGQILAAVQPLIKADTAPAVSTDASGDTGTASA